MVRHYRQSAGAIDSAGRLAGNQSMPDTQSLPLHAALEQVHDRQQRLARWIHDELAGNVNALQMLLQCPGAETAPTPQEVLSRLRLSLGKLEDLLGPAVLAHLGFSEALAQMLRSRGLLSPGLATVPEQPSASAAACLYRCAEMAVAAALPGQEVRCELERTAGLWQLQLGPVPAPAAAMAISGEGSALWSPELLMAWVRSRGGELDWAGSTPWGAGLRLVIPAP